MSNCLLTVFTGGTTTPAATFQDIGLAIPAQNPLVGDASGRIPLFFVADGTYHVRLTDQYGIMSNGGFDIPQLPSIGASSSGGGGAAVDPTTVASTGDLKWRLESVIIPGWVRINGRTIGNATSGASERANADTQALFIYIYNTYADAICPVPGGRGAGALADYNSNHQITLLDSRNSAIFGLDDMGNVARGFYTGVPFLAGNSIIPGSSGGEATHVLATGEIPAVPFAGTTATENVPHSHSYSAPVIAGANNNNGGGGGSFAAMGNSNSNFNTGTESANHTHTFGGNISGGGGAHNNTPRFLLGTLFWKL